MTSFKTDDGYTLYLINNRSGSQTWSDHTNIVPESETSREDMTFESGELNGLPWPHDVFGKPLEGEITLG